MTNQSITDCLYRIKENIKAVESGQTDQPILDEIESDFYDLMELIKLFLISERDTYYGYFLMNMSFRANFYCRSIAGIKLNTYPPVFESNPLLLCGFKLKEIVFIVCHEIEHIILNHPAEMAKANPTNDPKIFEKFNYAADASVNDRLEYEIENENRTFMTALEGGIYSKTFAKIFGLKKVRPLESYYYYFELIKNKDKCNNDDDQQDDSGSDDNYSAEREEIITSENCGIPEDHNWEAGEDAEDITAVIREFINASSEMMDDEIRGLMPAHFLEQVRLINEPNKISWKKILKKYVGTINAGKLKTRTRLNRRQPNRYDISGEMSDKVLKIVVAIDTSASVTGREIAMIFNEIFAILAKRRYVITVIECDSEIQRIYTVRKSGDVQTNVAGRGGTCFTPVIEYVNSERYFRDSLLIYFTDGYGESRIPRPLTYRNLWVITGHKNELSVKDPFGTVVAFEDGDN